MGAAIIWTHFSGFLFGGKFLDWEICRDCENFASTFNQMINFLFPIPNYVAPSMFI